MKTLGLLGGMSWESTASYYRHLNQIARERLGGHHSASLLIWSGDFASMVDLQQQGRWDEAGAVLADAARSLEGAGAEAILICANTMHLVADAVANAVGVPVLHVADVTAEAVLAAGSRRPLLLATRYTMEEPFYRQRLSAHGLAPSIPPRPDRDRLQTIVFDELVHGRMEPASRDAMSQMAGRATTAEGIDSVILGCTEFALLVGASDFRIPVFDTTWLHAKAAMDFALAP
jgi:aspartate racemase